MGGGNCVRTGSDRHLCSRIQSAVELLRVARNPWGQEVLLGLSWELLWLFVGAGALVIVVHALLARRLVSRHRADDGAGS